MKTLEYTIGINKPVEVVFNTMTDKSVHPLWGQAWGEGMNYEGEWKEGEHIAFFDQSQGGTKVLIEEIVVNESIKTKHVAMVNPQAMEIELADEMMKKWIGSREDYFFTADDDSTTTLKVVMVTDEAFEEMMQAWPKALQYLKEICESKI